MNNLSSNFFPKAVVVIAAGAIIGFALSALFNAQFPPPKKPPITEEISQAEKARGCGHYHDENLNSMIIACPK